MPPAVSCAFAVVIAPVGSRRVFRLVGLAPFAVFIPPVGFPAYWVLSI